MKLKILVGLLLITMLGIGTVYAQDNIVDTQTSIQTGGSLIANSSVLYGAKLKQYYQIWCYDKNGKLKWYDEFENLVPTVGLNKYLDATLKTGLVTPAWYVFIVTGPGSGTTYAAADTMASHSGWSEDSTYSNATRPTWTPGTISGGSVDNSASKATFNINGTATIAGAGMADNSTIGGTTGTLLGAGDFTGGDRSVISGDTLNVQVTCSMTAS